MGTYLSKPCTEKEYESGGNEFLSFISGSMQGWRKNQEDSVNCIIDFGEQISLFAVYDGHGGKEVAHLCANKLPEIIKNSESYKKANFSEALRESFLSLDKSILTKETQNLLIMSVGDIDNNEEKSISLSEEEMCQISNGKVKVFEGTSSKPGFYSGSTALVALIDRVKLKIHVANAGDSRCVLCRNGRAIDLSVDHKPKIRKERKRIHKAGGVLGVDGRINGGLNISRSIGDHGYKKNKSIDLKDQMISALPDVISIDLKPHIDEFLILACDGIWNIFSSNELVEFIKRRMATVNMKDLIAQIFNHCLAPNTTGDGIGCDNMTCVIITFNNEGDADITSVISDHSATKRRAEQPLLATDNNDAALKIIKTHL